MVNPPPYDEEQETKEGDVPKVTSAIKSREYLQANAAFGSLPLDLSRKCFEHRAFPRHNVNRNQDGMMCLY
jgi:hypothetical protein